jgi:hypothetical protein
VGVPISYCTHARFVRQALCSVYTQNAVLALKGVNENKHASASIETRNEKYTLTKILALPQQLRDPTSTALLPLVSSPTEPPTLFVCSFPKVKGFPLFAPTGQHSLFAPIKSPFFSKSGEKKKMT